VDTTTPPAAARRTRIFRRYVNRKFYDLAGSRYVNLGEIARAIRAGEEVRVIEMPTRRDLTGSILAWILSDEERRAATTSPEELSELIRRRPAATEALPPREAEAADPEVGPEPRPPTAHDLAHALLCRGQRAAFAARERTSAALSALERLDAATRRRVGEACDVVRGIERVRDRLARAARQIVELNERLRALEEQR
jgi:hypothetical protein